MELSAKQYLSPIAQRRIMFLLASGIIFIGIILRLILFFQNRNLIIDEANIVRNIYERGFFGLLKPLSYEQYAPPLFLWTEELFSHIFGYSEKAMRLCALLCGCGSLFVFWKLLRKILPSPAALLPLGLFCFGPVIVKYATEVKQYVPDTLIAITLVCLALHYKVQTISKKNFLLRWTILGSIAIWASQPSVFILATLGIYYFIECMQQKRADLIPVLFGIAAIWLAQFFIYYWVILREQINSDYLQNYHHDYFLYAIPESTAELRHNWIRFREILCNTVGYNMISLYLGTLFIIMGGIALLRKSFSLFVLIVGPVFITLLAAALHQFSLIERVCIFILPFTMILAGFGLSVLFNINNKVVKCTAAIIGLYILSLHNFGSLFYRKYQFNELTVGMDYVIRNRGKADEVYIDNASKDTYIYYTQIHPEKNKYASLSGGHILNWDDNFKEIALKVNTPRAYFIFTGGSPEAREQHLNEVRGVLSEKDHFAYFICYVFTFQKK